jgi:hypothetical protein
MAWVVEVDSSRIHAGMSIAVLRIAVLREDEQRRRVNASTRKEKAMSKLTGIVSLAGVTCLIFGSALAQSQSGPAQNPVEKETREPESGRLSPPMTPPIPRGPGPRVVKPTHDDVQAPRGNQDVQSPRENQDVQVPRGHGLVAARDVRAAQGALKAKGFDPGAIDGRMEPHTQAAVSDFQRSAGIRETGRFDSATLGQLGLGTSGPESRRSPARNRRSGDQPASSPGTQTQPTSPYNQPGGSPSDPNSPSQPGNRPTGR